MGKKIILFEILLIIMLMVFIVTFKTKSVSTIKIDVEKLTYNGKKIKSYTQETYDEFLEDYKNNKLPKIYIRTGSLTQISYFENWASLVYSDYVPA